MSLFYEIEEILLFRMLRNRTNASNERKLCVRRAVRAHRHRDPMCDCRDPFALHHSLASIYFAPQDCWPPLLVSNVIYVFPNLSSLLLTGFLLIDPVLWVLFPTATFGARTSPCSLECGQISSSGSPPAAFYSNEAHLLII
jgi:hypothetical protein